MHIPGRLLNPRFSSGERNLPILNIDQNPEPTTSITYRLDRDRTFIRAQAVIDNRNDSRLPCLGRPTDNLDPWLIE